MEHSVKAIGKNKKEAEKNAGWKMYDIVLKEIIEKEAE